MSAIVKSAVPAALNEPIHGLNLIDGAWVEARSGQRIDAINPSNYSLVGSAPASEAIDVDLAVAAARRTFEAGDWQGMLPMARTKVLFAVADLIEKHVEEITHLEVRDNGMPLSTAQRLVSTGAETFRYFAGWCTKIYGTTTNISAPGEYHSYTLREPLGVAGLIVPWNVPFIMACNKVAAALAAGCSVVLKPAEETPLSALVLGRLLLEAGVPHGVINIVCGLGETTGAAIASHPGVDKISFTGSTAVGRLIVRAAAGNLKKVSLELGGKSPIVVFGDADLDQAALAIARGIYGNSGQACIAGSRVFAHESIRKPLTERVATIFSKLKVGDGFEAGVDLGPLISERQLSRVISLVESGVKDGAEVVIGGARIARQGYFFTPTLLTAPRAGAQILKEEIFGPVANVLPFKDTAEVITAANNTDYGLAAGVWTRDIGVAHRMAKQIKSGMVWLNCQNIADRSMPFGGYKQSGWGREGSAEGLDAFLQTKSVYAAL